ncbi:glycosyl transferase [Streptomyces albus subsp. albus]|nr:glycosyl transferase [Streptomyces albus subsp. albus]
MRIRWRPTRTAGQHTAAGRPGGAPRADEGGAGTTDDLGEGTADGPEAGRAEAAATRSGAGRAGRRRKKRTGIRRFFTWRRVLAYVLSLWLLLLGAFAILYYAIDIPEANALAKAESNVYLYSDGTLLARTGEINRESVSIDRIPEHVQHAFVAAENKSFYKDAGVDPVGIARGLVNTLTGGGKQGGSTITQQYVKNYYLSQEQTITRKVKELVISLKVDQRNSKDEILAGYLNTSYFGRIAYGIQAAARAYYGKEAAELDVAEGAYLAALVQAPSQYDWAVASRTGRRLVTQRWNYVLDNMVEMGWLDPDERRKLRFPRPLAPKPTPGLDGQAGYLVEAARSELIASGVSEQELAAGGWTITLSVDRAKQRSLERAVARQLAAGGRGARDRAERANLQAGAVSVDPRTGRVLALYGGRDYIRHYLSNATRADYQAGAVFQPLIRAAELESDPRRAVPAKVGKGPVPEDTSTASSAEIKKTAVALGMDPDTGGFQQRRTIGLGLMGTSPMDLAGVYATLDNHGRKVTPTLVVSARRGDHRIDGRDGIGDQVVRRETADAVTSTLSGVPGEGRDGKLWSRTVNQAMASASGTSDDRKASWFAGYTPDLVTVVGVFGEDHRTRRQTTLPFALRGRPAKVWIDYTGEALRGARPAGFDLRAPGVWPLSVPSERPSGGAQTG